MKKLILSLLLLCGISLAAPAQEIYKEVLRIQKDFENKKNDTSKKLSERRIASFQWDAIQYMFYKAGSDSTYNERILGEQTDALIDFVKLYFKRLGEAKKQKDKDIVVTRFRNASLNNSYFYDTDKEVTLAYVDNPQYTTPFSLDTDWVKALAEIRSVAW